MKQYITSRPGGGRSGGAAAVKWGFFHSMEIDPSHHSMVHKPLLVGQGLGLISSSYKFCFLSPCHGQTFAC